MLVKWLRKAHGWIGLWGAILGLLFGTSGILLNHRAILKIPAVETQETAVELPLPSPAPRDAAALGAWLQQTLLIANPPTRVKQDKPRPVAWGDATITQPGRWSVSFVTPSNNVQAEYWVGNNTVSVKRNATNAFGVLANLHKGTGMGVAWILLVDTLAGSIILLSLSGVLLWTLTQRARVLGGVIAGVSLLTTVGLAAAALAG